MAGDKEGGYWRRLVRRLTTEVEDLDADDLSEQAKAGGAQRACDCRSG
ncbi:DNA-binding protein, partial [Kibdelosporangium lantanae]